MGQCPTSPTSLAAVTLRESGRKLQTRKQQRPTFEIIGKFFVVVVTHRAKWKKRSEGKAD